MADHLTMPVLPLRGTVIFPEITQVILPRQNEADLEDFSETVRDVSGFHCVDTLDEVFAIALRPAARCARRRGWA